MWASQRGVFSSPTESSLTISRIEEKNDLRGSLAFNDMAQVSVTYNHRGRLINRFVYSSGKVPLTQLTADEYGLFKSLTEEFMQKEMGITQKQN